MQSKLLAKCIIVCASRVLLPFCFRVLFLTMVMLVFLNKYDLLEKKLASGVKAKKYMPSFGDRENSAPVVAKCKLHTH